MKKFIKEIIANATLLSALILLPMTFRGPGWRPREAPDNFARSHRDINEGSELASGETQERHNDVLRAFSKDK